MNLKKIFGSNPCIVPVSKAEKETLECFLANKREFDDWLSHRPQQRVRFQFYFPTAIDFYFDDFHLFTAHFKRASFDAMELQELKMTKINYSSIRSARWKPFEEEIVNFLSALEETNKISYFSKTKSLHEYAAICEETTAANNRQNKLAHNINTAILTG